MESVEHDGCLTAQAWAYGGHEPSSQPPTTPELKTTNALRPHQWICFLVGMLRGPRGCMSQAPSHYWPACAHHPMNMCPGSCGFCGQGASFNNEHPRGGHVIGQRIASALESVEHDGSLLAQAWAYGGHEPSPQP